MTAADPTSAARLILGGRLHRTTPDGVIVARIVEVEAYGAGPDTPFPDPASHGYRGRTPRNQVMFGEAGHLYVYRSYGIHLCMNISYGPADRCGGVLLRALQIERGLDVVQARRGRPLADHRLASGPGNVGTAMGIELSDNGIDVFGADSTLRLVPQPLSPSEIAEGPRVGVAMAADRPWRLWVACSPAVSAYRRSPRAPVDLVDGDAERSVV
ncbi:DNA-3-methyladenine glycosylase [Jongsikchunia kroppenstedtii]|uniref:DNA-3-methyladenine glycosylase n=1 Tax=Jongsikchunia kroppenstedtii TaxID=1121721 RepID=UPI00037982B4|nr:DNA-3-methyladenine glycosylase [Jongsikchunia kroppenstedtii]